MKRAFQPLSVCVPAGTYVRLADGSQRPIEQIRLLDEVVTAEGRTGRVLHTMVRRADDGLVEVTFRGHMPLHCTPNHPVRTTRGYVAAKDLRNGDHVSITRYHAAGDDLIHVERLVNVKDLRGTIDGTINVGGVISEIAPLPTLLARTPSLGRLLGLYAAEGNVTPNKVTWTYGSHERDTLVPETCALIKDAFGATSRIQQRPNGAMIVVLYGKTWKRLFEILVPGTAKHGDKRLSAHVTYGPAPYLEALLDGWLAGDGSDRQDRQLVVGVTVCRQLALDMLAIATTLGRPVGLRQSEPSLNRHAATRQTRYDLSFPYGNGTNLPKVDDTAVWRRVQGVTSPKFDGWVYNLQVESDESYVADGVGVHDCIGASSPNVPLSAQRT
ncbi:hypothetical protein FKR81_06070 [Lentzea tibetensis]|uniref:DOD-type homing endonuclease domain-containing protein n=1 Tax=Lentzea tibetensis TaxID=2591470 RepID=A0A563F0L3_9PSEU|nr:hypothetical protein [Lentzea tibetensis]TWP53516.1 hypothetical protein FKR81_06070 [Lentzea tibetensis]